MIKRATIGSGANYGESIKARRKALGLSIKEVSERTGISSVTISRWENGKRIPTVKAYDKIMTALGVELYAVEK